MVPYSSSTTKPPPQHIIGMCLPERENEPFTYHVCCHHQAHRLLWCLWPILPCKALPLSLPLLRPCFVSHLPSSSGLQSHIPELGALHAPRFPPPCSAPLPQGCLSWSRSALSSPPGPCASLLLSEILNVTPVLFHLTSNSHQSPSSRATTHLAGPVSPPASPQGSPCPPF